MGRLADRCRRASTEAAPVTTGGRMLPFSCCRDFLTSHLLVTTFRLSATEVHDAIVQLDIFLHTRDTPSLPTSLGEDEDFSQNNPDDIWGVFEQANGRVGCAQQLCIECSSTSLFLDHVNAYMVCGECGMVQTRGTINVIPEFVKAVDDLPRKRRRGIQGVPNWMVQQLACAGDDDRPATYMDDLEHMNASVNLVTDDLHMCERWLQRWSSSYLSRDLRVAAALLYPALRGRFLKEDEVRRCVRTVVQHAGTEERDGRIVPSWRMTGGTLSMCPTDMAPQPTHPCPDCGVLQHCRKSARYHCRHATKFAR